MADEFQVRAVLRRIRSAGQDPIILAQALAIYHLNTPKLEATASNEIQFWADHYNDDFQDQLYLFALELNNAIVGFAECVYFKEERFIILDYMTLSPSANTVATFLLFYEQIRSYFVTSTIDYNYFVIELLQNDEQFTQSSELWKTIMALENFRVIDAPYIQLQLGRSKFETRTSGRIIVDLDSDVSQIRAQSYLMIVKTLLFKHYVRWYLPFMSSEETGAYEADAKAVYDQIKSKVHEGGISLSRISGTIIPVGPSLASYQANTRLIAFETASYVLLLALLVGARVLFALGASDIILLAVAALVVRLALVSIFVPEARASLNASISLLHSLLGKKNPVVGNRQKSARRRGERI